MKTIKPIQVLTQESILLIEKSIDYLETANEFYGNKEVEKTIVEVKELITELKAE
jgi:hypothetical protein